MPTLDILLLVAVYTVCTGAVYIAVKRHINRLNKRRKEKENSRFVQQVLDKATGGDDRNETPLFI